MNRFHGNLHANPRFVELDIDKNYTKNSESVRDLFSYNYIKKLKESNMSTKTVVEKLDTTHRTASKWRRGTIPNDEFFRLLCLLFDCDFMDFFRRD